VRGDREKSKGSERLHAIRASSQRLGGFAPSKMGGGGAKNMQPKQEPVQVVGEGKRDHFPEARTPEGGEKKRNIKSRQGKKNSKGSEIFQEFNACSNGLQAALQSSQNWGVYGKSENLETAGKVGTRRRHNHDSLTRKKNKGLFAQNDKPEKERAK